MRPICVFHWGLAAFLFVVHSTLTSFFTLCPMIFTDFADWDGVFIQYHGLLTVVLSLLYLWWYLWMMGNGTSQDGQTPPEQFLFSIGTVHDHACTVLQSWPFCSSGYEGYETCPLFLLHVEKCHWMVGWKLPNFPCYIYAFLSTLRWAGLCPLPLVPELCLPLSVQDFSSPSSLYF